MRTSAKKKLSQRPAVRSLRISERIRVNDYSKTEYPELRLAGNWMAKLGFKAKEKVKITTMNKLLIIQLDVE